MRVLCTDALDSTDGLDSYDALLAPLALDCTKWPRPQHVQLLAPRSMPKRMHPKVQSGPAGRQVRG